MKTTCNKKNPLRPAGGSLRSPVSSEYPLKKALDSYKYLLLLVFFISLIACQCPVPTDPEDDGIAATNIAIDQNVSRLPLTDPDGTTNTGTFSATVLPSNHTDGEVSWYTSDANVLRLEGANYTLTGLGEVTVTARVGLVSNDLIFEVVESSVAATNIAIDQNVSRLPLTDPDGTTNTGTFSATVLPSNHTDGEVSWSTSDANILSLVGSNYTLTGLGEVTVTARVGLVSNDLTFIVTESPVEATSIAINQNNFTITNNTAATNGTLSATVSPTDHTDGEVLWTSSDNRLSVSGNNTTASYVALFDGRDINEVVTVSAWVSDRPQLSNSIEITLYHLAASNIVFR